MCVMYAILFFAVGAYCQLPSKAQTGQITTIIPYKIQVSDLATTILLFPFEVKDADLGVGELLATKIPDVKNVLKLKAEKPTLDTTSLYVCTTDGKIHVFEVTYTARPNPMAYELTESGTLVPSPNANVSFRKPEHNDRLMLEWRTKVREAPVTTRKTHRKLGISATLTGVFSIEDLVFLRFIIHNRSSLPYRPGWTQFVLKDEKAKKRSTIQELPVMPYYQDSLQEINGDTSWSYCVALPRQTVPPAKRMFFELHESNGGRNIIFRIRNKYLLGAKKL